jgi:CSLREA domain-containing protein
VNSTADDPDVDTSDHACVTAAGVCTFRAAIQQVNETAGDHIIAFDLPDDGDGVPTITLGASLPAVQFEFAASLLIDGYTQPGAQPNTTQRCTRPCRGYAPT